MVTLQGVHAPPPVLNVPVEHSPSQTASLLAVPAIRGLPLGQIGVECLMQLVLSVATLWCVAPLHGSHFASADALPLAYPFDAGHDGIVHALHGFALSATLNWPPLHDAHDPSFVVSPFVKPSPILQDESE